jgi:hypothetical protein
VAAVALVALDALVRVAGGPYVGATVLLLAACGLALLAFLPRELGTPSLQAAVAPALAVGAFAALLTTISVVGIPLSEGSIRLSVAALVVGLVVLAALVPRPGRASPRVWTPRGELVALAVLTAVTAFAFTSSWDLAYPFQARGTDWGHYLLYADEVEAQQSLLIDDPLAGEDDRVFADPPAVGAVYGSFLILDGISSWTLTWGLLVVSALTVLSVYAAVGGLWGVGAGLVAAGAYAVAPIRLDPMYWHGLGTTLALLFLPLTVLALGLLYRGSRDRRTVLLLAVSLASVAAAHATSALVVAVVVLLAPLVDAVRRLLVGRPALRGWWRDGIVRPVLAGIGLALLLGAGVLAHLLQQSARLGEPVSYRFLGPDWLDRAAIEGYYSWEFLAVAAVALALVVSSRRLRGDPALLAALALALACVAVEELWRLQVPFEYRRVVYYLAIALVLVVGVASLRFRPRAAWIAVWVVAFAYLAHLSVGLRLPQRALDGSEPRDPAVTGLIAFRERLYGGELPEGRLVSDPCLHFAVPYLVRRPTLPAFGERQVGFVDRLPLARKAARVLEGGAAGRAVAADLGVRYAVADPECAPGLAARLDGTVVLGNEGVVVVLLPETG